MVHRPEDAKDATQEVLIKLFTRLSTFDGRSSLRTWLYRIVVNHLLNMKRGRAEAREITFAQYGQSLDDTPDAELPDTQAVPADVQLLIAEARIGCTSGMLLCLDRGQRLVFILQGDGEAGEEGGRIAPPDLREARGRERSYAPLRRFQKPRGFVIRMPALFPTASRSLSPVTSTSALAATAEARTQASSASLT